MPVKYRQDIDNAVNLLKKEGCEAVFLFGSMVTGKIRHDSDIDICVKGLPPEKFFNVYSKLYTKLDNDFHLVDFDYDNSFFSLLQNQGEVLEIG